MTVAEAARYGRYWREFGPSKQKADVIVSLRNERKKWLIVVALTHSGDLAGGALVRSAGSQTDPGQSGCAKNLTATSVHR